MAKICKIDARRLYDEPVDLSIHGYSFVEMLRAESKKRTRPKRERTSFLLLASTAELLCEDLPDQLTVERVVTQAGSARGTFYSHFQDVHEIMTTVLVLFVNIIWRQRPPRLIRPTPKELLTSGLVFYCRIFELNASLLRASDIVVDKSSELSRNRQKVHNNLIDITTQAYLKRFPGKLATTDQSDLRKLLMLLTCSLDEALRRRFCRQDPIYLEVFPTSTELAHGMSKLWVQTLFKT